MKNQKTTKRRITLCWLRAMKIVREIEIKYSK